MLTPEEQPGEAFSERVEEVILESTGKLML